MTDSNDLNKVRELAASVNDAYPDFINAMVNGAKRHNVAESLIQFMEEK